MASIGYEGRDKKRKRIVFRNSQGRQRTLRLGDCPERVAEAARVAVEHLLNAKRLGSVPHSDATRWLEGVDDKIYARVAALGLCQPRKGASTVTLGELLKAFFEAVDVKPASMVRMRQAETTLIEKFSAARDVATIEESDADQWRASLLKAGYAPATVSRTVLYARQIFRWGVKRKLAKHNPFLDLKAGSQVNTERSAFISRETIAKVIDAAPDAEWRLLIVLSRFGGLRVPSEALSLRWTDVDWEHNRLSIRSPKTEHHEGKGGRIIPLFPEIREHLQAVFDAAEPGAEYVITRYREGSNLNPALRRIVMRAGLQPWERTWHNLRASRQTELAATFPLHTVCAWIGNTKAIAAGHYLQVTDADWTRATGAQKAAANPAAEARPITPTGYQPKTKHPRISREIAGVGTKCDAVESGLVGRAGLEPATPAFSMRCSTN